MKPMRAYLVDDEPLALRRLARFLEQTGRVEIIGQSTDPLEVVDVLPSLQCDVLFTDIEMPDLSGFLMLKQLTVQPLVVFTTAYSQYALKAFEVHSVDYLLKPVDVEQLGRALTKLERVLGGTEPRPQLDKLLEHLAASLVKPTRPLTRLPSKLGDRIEFVEVPKVTHFYASDKLTFASTPKKDFVLDLTITELETRLDPERFVRIHRSTIVNLDFVKDLHSWFSERLLLRINDGKDTELTVSRERVRVLKEKLGV